MSAPDPARGKGILRIPLLVVIDPVARLTDGESVRIARDVLCAGTPGVKVCLPDDPDETARALARRGSRRPVLVGNDRALTRVVGLLHREGALHEAALSVVPVGNGPSVALARALGVPLDTVAAARAVLSGAEHGLDLLVDDGGEVVLGGLRVPAGSGPGNGPWPVGETPSPPGPRVPRQGTGPEAAERNGRTEGSPLRRACRSVVRTVLPQGLRAERETAPEGAPAVRRGALGPGVAPHAGTPQAPPPAPSQRLRVEADGKLLADLDEPVGEVSVRTTHDGGLAEVTVRPVTDPSPVRAMARAVTVSGGPDFRYRTDTARVGGPVASRTWTVLPRAWRLVLPADGDGEGDGPGAPGVTP